MTTKRRTKSKAQSDLILSARLNRERDQDLIEALSHIRKWARSGAIRGALRMYLRLVGPDATGENRKSHTVYDKPTGESKQSHTKYDIPTDPLPMPTQADRRRTVDLREAGHAPDEGLPAGYDSPIARALRAKQAGGVK